MNQVDVQNGELLVVGRAEKPQHEDIVMADGELTVIRLLLHFPPILEPISDDSAGLTHHSSSSHLADQLPEQDNDIPALRGLSFLNPTSTKYWISIKLQVLNTIFLCILHLFF
ncbi:hypothetical protein [Escherichia albertii]|uniref:hypothetical protein n=1 Tax=Escherichia albertii TaxID=208962 RepID=UPI003FCD0BE9